MKRILFSLPIIFSMVILLSNATHDNVKPCYTTDIAITESGNILLANKGTSELRLIDNNGKKLKSWGLEEPATGVATIGSRAYVTSSYAKGSISCIETTGEQQILFTTTTAMGACAPVVSHDSKVIYVCNRYRGTVSEVDAITGAILREVEVLREPCAATLSKDGTKLYVNNFLPMQRADVDYVSAAVSVIDCATFKKISDITL
jgi:DNA-binding beta-propeller fold protein YncE